VVAAISTDAYVGLLGVGVGFVFGFFGDLARTELQARSDRKVAALLVYGELTSNLAAASALRKFGVWTAERIHRSAWEGHGHALLFRGDSERAGRIVMAYNTLEDVDFLASDRKLDFTQGSDAAFFDSTLVPVIYGPARVGPPRQDPGQGGRGSDRRLPAGDARPRSLNRLPPIGSSFRRARLGSPAC
jgi:hypothetical protein